MYQCYVPVGMVRKKTEFILLVYDAHVQRLVLTESPASDLQASLRWPAASVVCVFDRRCFERQRFLLVCCIDHHGENKTSFFMCLSSKQVSANDQLTIKNLSAYE